MCPRLQDLNIYSGWGCKIRLVLSCGLFGKCQLCFMNICMSILCSRVNLRAHVTNSSENRGSKRPLWFSCSPPAQSGAGFKGRSGCSSSEVQWESWVVFSRRPLPGVRRAGIQPPLPLATAVSRATRRQNWPAAIPRGLSADEPLHGVSFRSLQSCGHQCHKALLMISSLSAVPAGAGRWAGVFHKRFRAFSPLPPLNTCCPVLLINLTGG